MLKTCTSNMALYLSVNQCTCYWIHPLLTSLPSESTDCCNVIAAETSGVSTVISTELKVIA